MASPNTYKSKMAWTLWGRGLVVSLKQLNTHLSCHPEIQPTGVTKKNEDQCSRKDFRNDHSNHAYPAGCLWIGKWITVHIHTGVPQQNADMHNRDESQSTQSKRSQTTPSSNCMTPFRGSLRRVGECTQSGRAGNMKGLRELSQAMTKFCIQLRLWTT